MSNSNNNDSAIANMLQKDELNFTMIEFEEYINVENSIKEQFMCKTQRNIRLHYNLDQTIEETLDEMNYEKSLNDLIKTVAFKASDFVPHSYEACQKLFKHAFETARRSNMDKVKPYFEQCCSMIQNTEEIETHYILKIQNVFNYLLNMDYECMLIEFKSLPFSFKFNLLKNLIYYCFKYFLFNLNQTNFSKLFFTLKNDNHQQNLIENDDESLKFFLFSIVVYIQSFKFF
jgi:hypothetical protein